MASNAWRRLAVRNLIGLCGALTLYGLVGCASTPSAVLPPGTLTIGEVMHVLTSELVAAGAIAPMLGRPESCAPVWRNVIAGS